MATVLGVDVSHWQGTVDWPKVRAAGHEFAVLKATESTNYVDPTFAANRARARAAGLVVGMYHFARAGDPGAEANAFVAAIGSLAPDEFAVLDWEVSPAGVDAVSWCGAFCTAVKSRTGRLPLIYMNGPRVARDDWSRLVAMGVRLWLAGDGVNARYDNDPKPVTVKWWGAPAIKQYTESGSVPSIGGGVDLNVFYGDTAALKALAAGGSNDQEDDMKLDDTISWTRPDNGQVVTDTVSNWLAWTNWYSGQAAVHIDTLSKTVDSLVGLVAEQNGLTVADVQRVVEQAIARGIDVAISVNGQPAAGGSGPA